MRALIASGSGRYSDPWHPFDRTSPRLREILTGVGFDVDIEDDVDRAMQRLEGVSLLVVNAGDPWRSSIDAPAPPAASIEGFDTALRRGFGILALHCAVSTMRDYPEWFPAIGAMWVPGSSWHPPADRVVIRRNTSPTDAGELSFDVFDECYCRLQRLGSRVEVAHHEATGEREAVAWTREYRASRIAVDTLGHDELSYDSAGHRRLVERLSLWAGARGDFEGNRRSEFRRY